MHQFIFCECFINLTLTFSGKNVSQCNNSNNQAQINLHKYSLYFPVSPIIIVKTCPCAQRWQVISNSSPPEMLWYKIWHHRLISQTKTKWEGLEAFQNLMDTNYAALPTPFVFCNWNYNGGFPSRAEAFS